MTRRQISDCLDHLSSNDTIVRWRYHADKFGHEAWEVVFDEIGVFDTRKYYTRNTIEQFVTRTFTPWTATTTPNSAASGTPAKP